MKDICPCCMRPDEKCPCNPAELRDYARAVRVGAPQPFAAAHGRPCAKCGEPVYPPTTRHQPAALVIGEQIWHGWCVPSEGHGTFLSRRQVP